MSGPRPTLLRAGIILGAALMLQGCLAAAIPVLAGSALATKDVIEDGFAGSEKQKSVEVAQGASQAELAEATAVPDVPNEIVSEDGQRLTVLELTELPAPDGSTSSSPPGLGLDEFARFANYAMQATSSPVGEGEAYSALLANPGALDGERAPCGLNPAAVLIDLDPEDGVVALEGTSTADRRMANLLESLRRQDITIGWISGRFADDASDIRKALATAGLDPLGQDTLLLMRYADDRKQVRRREFAEDYCLVAIAGDTRSDFDELYQYLNDPDHAVALEPLYGDGWFLTPLPLIQE